MSAAKRLAKLSLNAGPFSTGGKEEPENRGRYGPVSPKPPKVLRQTISAACSQGGSKASGFQAEDPPQTPGDFQVPG